MSVLWRLRKVRRNFAPLGLNVVVNFIKKLLEKKLRGEKVLVLEKIVIDVISLQPLIIMWPSINASPPTIVAADEMAGNDCKDAERGCCNSFVNHFA